MTYLNKKKHYNEKSENSCPSISLKEILLLLVLGVIVLAIYSNTLSNPFVFDDVSGILNNRNIRLGYLNFENIKKVATNGPYSQRPIANISFALNYHFHQYRVAGYHIINILIHMVTGVLLYLLLRTTLCVNENRICETGYAGDALSHISEPQSLMSRISEPFIFIPFFTTAIWLTHPIQTQSVTYIIQRMNSMAAMLYILSLFLYVRGRIAQKQKTCKSESASFDYFQSSGIKYFLVAKAKNPVEVYLYFTGSIISGLLAIGSKENAAMLPLFIFIYEWLFFQSLSKKWILKYSYCIICIIVFFIILAAIFFDGDPVGWMERKYASKSFTMDQRLLTESRVVIYYLSLIVFPHPSRLNLDYDFPLSTSLTEPITTFISISAFIAIAFALIFISKKDRLLSFCIIWFFGNLIIESSVIGLDIIYEHRCYLPSMFVSVAVVMLTVRYMKPKWLMTIMLSAVVILFSIWTYARNNTWRSDVTLWQDCVDKSPKKIRPHCNLGSVLWSHGRNQEAVLQYNKVLRMWPDQDGAHSNLGTALVSLGRFEEAFKHYYKALSINPENVSCAYNFGNALFAKGRVDEAIDKYIIALRNRSDFSEAHNSLGVAFFQKGRLDDAIAHFKEALKIDNANAEAYNNLGKVFEKQGQNTEAADYYIQALRIKPNFTEAKRNLLSVMVTNEKCKKKK